MPLFPTMTTPEMQSRRASPTLSHQPIQDMNPTGMIRSISSLENLGRTVNLSVFQELLDLDTYDDPFSKEVVKEFFVLAPDTLTAMDDSITYKDLSQLGRKSQYLRSASMVLGLKGVEKACTRIDTILAMGVELHYTGIGLSQICSILGFVVKDARIQFEMARTALEAFYHMHAPCTKV